MFSNVPRPRFPAAAVLLASASALAPAHAIAPERALYLLTDDNRIGVVFDGAASQAAPAPVTGLVAGDALVAIDVRPQNHRLYALGFNAASGTVRLYHVDLASGTPRAAAVGTTGGFVAADGATPVPVAGSAFGIDFNPTVDRLRVVNDAGQNFRMNPNNGALADGNAGAAGTQMDGALNGAATRAVDTAYTNSIVNASVTTQYALDSAANELYIQNPPNNGTLTAARPITLGGNPLDFGADTGFDIPPGIDVASAAAPASGFAYAALTVGGNAGLYRIELSTGAATSVGALGGLAVRDLAVANLVPAALALSADGAQLHRFALDRPGTLASVAVTGLVAGERLVGIDLRPTTAQYYGLGVNPAADTATLYLVDPQPGAANVATAIGTPGQIAAAFADGSYGVDFNPTVDRVRVVSDSGLNLRLHPDTGALVATDTAINGSGVTGASATAYANNFATPTFTTQYTIDAVTDALYIQNPPNNGTQTQRQALTLGGEPLDVATAAALDIPPGAATPGANGAALGDGYAALTVGGVSGLYRIALSSGAATFLGAIGSGATALEGLVVPFGTVGPERGIVVLTNGGEVQLATESQPNQVTAALALQGLVGDDTLVALDVRPQNNRLYGLGFDSGAGTVRLYHLDLNAGVALATPVGTAGSHVAGDGTTVVPVAGTAFGIDFNPTVDRVRVVTNAGQNFRMNPNNGALVDGDGGAPGTQMDGGLNGAASSGDDTAYTNSVVNATVTTQYTLDSATDAIYIQNPPNNGTLTAAMSITSGGAPLDFGAESGFDIPPRVDVGASNATASGHAYAALQVGAGTGLYRIDLGSGAATRLGTIGAASVRDIAVVPMVPGAIALSADGAQLLRFELARPDVAVSVPVTGMAAGERLVGIDIRPSTGQYYGLGINAVTDTGTLYRLDPQPGAANLATAVGTPGGITYAGIDFGVGAWGFDFNPTVDRVRVVSDTGLNFRVHPDTGAPVVPADGALNGAAVGAAGTAYANPFPFAAAGTTFTTQYTLDPATDAIYIQNPPNAGTQTAPLPLTVGGAAFDAASNAGFDIPVGVGASAANLPAVGSGYAAMTAGLGGATALYAIDLSTGAARAIGAIGTGALPMEGLSVSAAPIEVALSVPSVSVTSSAGELVVTVTRSGGAPLIVGYATQSRTAIAGSDYTAVSGTLFFAANERTKTITIPILGDAADGEGSEYFVLVLSGPFTTGGSAAATITILPELIFRDGFE